jgi:hypothetical protein
MKGIGIGCWQTKAHTFSVDLCDHRGLLQLRGVSPHRLTKRVGGRLLKTEVLGERHHIVVPAAHMPSDLIPPGVPRPRILISNDDGINAPGLRALVAELHVQEFCDILVCGPAGERSAQSHAITLGKELLCSPINIQGDTTEDKTLDGNRAYNGSRLVLYGGAFLNC